MLLWLVPSVALAQWLPNRPAGTDTFEVSDDYIRANWTAIDTVIGNLATQVGFSVDSTGRVVCPVINTGQGYTEVYLMDQNLRVTDGVTFASVTVGDLGVDILVVDEIHFAADTTDVHGVTTDFKMTIKGDLAFTEFVAESGTLTADFYCQSVITETLNTGHGDNELYAMDQDVMSESNVAFNELTVQFFNLVQDGGVSGSLYVWGILDVLGSFTAATSTFSGPITTTLINTGPGLTEVHLMDQDVREEDSVYFASVETITLNTGHGFNELYQMDQDVTTTSNVEFKNATFTSVTGTYGYFSRLAAGSMAYPGGWTGWFDDNTYFRVAVSGGLVVGVGPSFEGGYAQTGIGYCMAPVMAKGIAEATIGGGWALTGGTLDVINIYAYNPSTYAQTRLGVFGSFDGEFENYEVDGSVPSTQPILIHISDLDEYLITINQSAWINMTTSGGSNITVYMAEYEGSADLEFFPAINGGTYLDQYCCRQSGVKPTPTPEP